MYFSAMVKASCYTHFAFSPYKNMAVDEYLFQQALDRPGSVTLRLYTWSPGAITFGLNQKLEKAVDHDALNGCTLIRRVTGGRALYHDPSELTYAVIVNTDGVGDERMAGSVSRTSAVIAEGLTRYLARLGMASQYLRHTRQDDKRPSFFHTAPCFASVARHEIVSDDRKIVASAQRRLGTTLLQHGSIKIRGVAYHPALDGPGCPADRADGLHPVTAQEFQVFSEEFFAELGQFLTLECEPCTLSEEAEKAVEERAVEVEKKALARRDITKQEPVDGSLSIGERASVLAKNHLTLLGGST